MSSYSLQMSPSTSSQAGGDGYLYRFCPSIYRAPHCQENRTSKTSYTNKFRGACTLHTTTTATYGGGRLSIEAFPLP